jgi:hypothetical protein
MQTQWDVQSAVAVSYWEDFCEIWWQEGKKKGRKKSVRIHVNK